MVLQVNFARMAKKSSARTYKNRLPRSGDMTRENVNSYLVHLEAQMTRLRALAMKMGERNAPVEAFHMDGVNRPARAISEMHEFLDDLERGIKRVRREKYGLAE